MQDSGVKDIESTFGEKGIVVRIEMIRKYMLAALLN
jgi:hypothetical protein